jgi:hypothetical protein
MPIHIRNFYYKKLVDAKEQEQKQYKQSSSSKSPARGPNVSVRK